MATERLVLAAVSEPNAWNDVHYNAVADGVTRAGGSIVRFDGPRSPQAERGLSLRQRAGRTSILLGEDEIRPDAVWLWDPIARERDGLVSAAVQQVVDPSEVVLASALRNVMRKGGESYPEVLVDLAHREVVRHFTALETAFPEHTFLNPPAVVRRVANKPYNLQAAADQGFVVPGDTLFCQDPAVRRAWVREQFGRGPRARVLWKFAVNAAYRAEDDKWRKFPATELRRADEPNFPYEIVRYMPLIFEPVVDGDRDLRVVVAGHEVFAAQVIPLGEPVTLDPRAGDHCYEPYDGFSPAQQKKCVKYVASLGLRYGVIDFRLTHDDQRVFLEAQGDGTFAEVEKTGQNVGRAVARLLLRIAGSAPS
jgi:hypothetical protein